MLEYIIILFFEQYVLCILNPGGFFKTMIKIAVCDDEKSQLKYLCSVIRKWSDSAEKECSVEAFESAEEFWFAYGRNRFDIAVLDIQMDGQNGMELARELRKLNDKISIIFVTGISDFIGEGYDVRAVNYLMKPVEEKKLFAALEASWEKRDEKGKKVLFETSDGTCAVYEDCIEYIEAFSHSTALRADGETLEIPKGINTVMSKLSPDKFIKCHRSYGVNLECVKQIVKYEILLDSGEKVPVSRRMYGDVNRAFISFYKGNTK